MGRVLRRVPANWVHPKGSDGRSQRMHDRSYREACEEWKEGYSQWEKGLRLDYVTGQGDNWIPLEEIPDDRRKFLTCEYWDYAGPPPDQEYYRPEWSDAERTHFQMYENTTEGTPISPVFADVESLCRWLAANGASIFGKETATYEEWMRVCGLGYTIGAVLIDGEFQSSVKMGF